MKIKKIENKYNEPKIEIDFDVWQKMNAMVDISDKEIAWLGLVKKEQDNTYYVYDIKTCEQEISAVTAELHEKGLQQIAEELIEENRADELNNVRLWGHSHVKMNVTPSGTDDDTFKEYYKGCGDYFIRLILNKSGKIHCDLADYETGLIFEEIDVYLRYEDEVNKINQKIYELELEIEQLEEKKKQLCEEKYKRNKEIMKPIVKKISKEHKYTYSSSWSKANKTTEIKPSTNYGYSYNGYYDYDPYTGLDYGEPDDGLINYYVPIKDSKTKKKSDVLIWEVISEQTINDLSCCANAKTARRLLPKFLNDLDDEEVETWIDAAMNSMM